MSTSTHMGTYPCICSSSQQHSSLKKSHLQKLASCSLSQVAEQKNENQCPSDSDTVYQVQLCNSQGAIWKSSSELHLIASGTLQSVPGIYVRLWGMNNSHPRA